MNCPLCGRLPARAPIWPFCCADHRNLHRVAYEVLGRQPMYMSEALAANSGKANGVTETAEQLPLIPNTGR